VKAQSSSIRYTSRHNLFVAIGALPLTTTTGQENTKEKKKLRLLVAALIDQAHRSHSAGRPPWTQAKSHHDLLPDVAPAHQEAEAPTHLICRDVCAKAAQQPSPSPPVPRRRTAQQHDAPDLTKKNW
jgi:hypothetical protein